MPASFSSLSRRALLCTLALGAALPACAALSERQLPEGQHPAGKQR